MTAEEVLKALFWGGWARVGAREKVDLPQVNALMPLDILMNGAFGADFLRS
jgi:hypothetical protein